MSFKVATFNANGVRARLGIIIDWLEENRPDLLCLQETKVQDKDFPKAAFEKIGYLPSFLGQKSYNGVALISKEEPDSLLTGFPSAWDEQARVISANIEGVQVINTYVPQGRDVKDPAFQYKLRFFKELGDWFRESFDPEEPLIWLGDLNVAPTDLDVHDPEKLYGRVCFHPVEHKALAKVMDFGLADLFRMHHPDERLYTFWDYRVRGAMSRGLGWRIDHILGTAPLAEACTACWVDEAPRKLEKPSDHTFLIAEFDL